jgi:hypothetical protein
LLQSFLIADKKKLLHMLVDAIATQLGLDSTETFVQQFLPQIDTNIQPSHRRATWRCWRLLERDS